ncbi:MAG: hypothetical protein AAB930_03550 [Patescibacteria group bacterium]
MPILDELTGQGEGEKTYKCEKCGKEKKESEGKFMLEGSAFCCKECCGDADKGEHKEKKPNVCEFC